MPRRFRDTIQIMTMDEAADLRRWLQQDPQVLDFSGSTSVKVLGPDGLPSTITADSPAHALAEVEAGDVVRSVNASMSLWPAGEEDPTAHLSIEWPREDEDLGIWMAEVEVSGTDRALVAGLLHGLRQAIGQPAAPPSIAAPPGAEPLPQSARDAIETVFTFWSLHAGELGLTPSEVDLGDKVASGVQIVLKHDQPPRGLLREAIRWFLHKADVAIEEAAKSVGKAAGPAAGMYLAHRLGLWEELRGHAGTAAGAIAGP